MEGTAYDAIIIGGALSGSATGFLAKRKEPGLKILIIERSEAFSRRVGESTVEISSYFLGRILGLTDYLQENHLPKQGLRFWFHNEAGRCPDSCSEIGPHYNVRLASYQVDRAKLDEHLLEKCRMAGIEVMRPAEVKGFELQAGGFQTVTVKQNGETRELTTRWLIDASGVAKILARKSGWVRRNEAHPIASAWARWRGVKSWDSPDLRERFPAYAGRAYAVRNTATNHLVGDGWWSWWIPLKGGDVSVGVVYDERRVQTPPGEKPIDRLKGLLEEHPLAHLFLENAECLDGDVHWRKNLPYYAEHMVGDGFALVGDAAGFIDPFYSPGMDWISFTSYNAADLVVRSRKGGLSKAEIASRDALFRRSYERWFAAIYKDKYDYMGDWELMKIAFRLDLGLYYIGVVSQPYKYGPDSFLNPPLAGPYNRFPAWLLRTYNRRLAAMGRKRRERGTWGKANHGRYYPFQSYGFDNKLVLRVLAALASWLLLEIREGWRSWGRAAGTREEAVDATPQSAQS